MQIPIRRLDPRCRCPTRSNRRRRSRSVAREGAMLEPGGGRCAVPTGIAIAIPEGYAGFVQPRSGLALRPVSRASTPRTHRRRLPRRDPRPAREHRSVGSLRGPARGSHRPTRRSNGSRPWNGTKWKRSTSRHAASMAGARAPAPADRRDRTLLAPWATIADSASDCIARNTESGKEFTELARRAEALGFSTLFVPDHFVDHELAPHGCACARGRRHRHAARRPARARQRLQASRSCSRASGDARPAVGRPARARHRRRLDDGRLREGRDAARSARRAHRAARRVDHDPQGPVRPTARSRSTASTTTVTELDGQPKPVQRPHPPFIVGGGGPKILALAAQEAQIVGHQRQPAVGRRHIARRRALAHVGGDRRRSSRRCGPRRASGSTTSRSRRWSGSCTSPTTRVAIVDAMAGSFGVDREDARMAPVTLVGNEAEIVDLLERRRERWQMSYVVLPDDALDACAPIVARLAGT